jgi:hypothetical protein
MDTEKEFMDRVLNSGLTPLEQFLNVLYHFNGLTHREMAKVGFEIDTTMLKSLSKAGFIRKVDSGYGLDARYVVNLSTAPEPTA